MRHYQYKTSLCQTVKGVNDKSLYIHEKYIHSMTGLHWDSILSKLVL
jgi:hypothetical protein